MKKSIFAGAEAGFWAAKRLPVVGKHVAEFVHQTELLDNLLTHEGEQEAVRRAQEVGMLRQLGPEHEYTEKRLKLARFAAELYGFEKLVVLDRSRNGAVPIPPEIMPPEVAEELHLQ